jgi:hypothetical protein
VSTPTTSPGAAQDGGVSESGAPKHRATRLRGWLSSRAARQAADTAALATATNDLAESTAALADAEKSQLMVRAATVKYERENGIAAPPPPADPGPKIKWTFGKVLWSVLLGSLVIALWAGLASVAIGWQTGFLNKAIPESVKVVKIFFGPEINIPKWGPLGAELISSVFALMTIALVLQHKSFGRWHRAMWMISLGVAVLNAWHITDTAKDIGIGVLFGAYSIAGPWLLHMFVLFLQHLRSTSTGLEALVETASDLRKYVTLVLKALGWLIKAIIGVLRHPLLTIELVSEWSRPQPTFARTLREEERKLELTLATRVRRRELIAEYLNPAGTPVAAPAAIAAPIPDKKTKSTSTWSLFPWRKKKDAKKDESAIQGMGVHQPTTPVEQPAQVDEPVGDPRTDTPLAGPIEGDQRGGVLTASREPEDDRDAVADTTATASGDPAHPLTTNEQTSLADEFAAVLGDEEAFRAQLDQLVRGASSTDLNDLANGERSADERPSAPPANTVRDERSTPAGGANGTAPSTDEQSNTGERSGADPTVRPGARDEQAADEHPGAGERSGERPHRSSGGPIDRSPRRSDERSTPLTSTSADERSNDERSNGGVPARGERSNAGAPGTDERSNGGERSGVRPTVRPGARDEQAADEQSNTGERSGRPGTSQERSGERSSGVPESPTGLADTGTLGIETIIALEYFKLLDSGTDMSSINMSKLARESGWSAGTVRRVFAECKSGKKARPTPVNDAR